MKFGVYCSPWDRNAADYASDGYVATYHAQLRELYGGAYGDVFEAWFDGANGGDGWYGGAKEKRQIKDDYYRMGEIMRLVRDLQPCAAVFAGKPDDADLRWPGNERGFLDPDSRATTVETGWYAGGGYGNGAYVPQRNTGTPGGRFFRVCEADFPLRRGWFYHAREDGTTKSGAYLAKVYVGTVGNGGTMNIGVAPNKAGRLADDDVRALRRFGEFRRALFANEVKPGEPFNVVMMREDVTRGERVDEWELVADGETLFRGKSIGNKRIRLLPKPCAAKSCEVRVLRGVGEPRVALTLYRAPEGTVRAVLDAVGDDRETETVGYVTAQAAEGAAAPSGGGRGGKGTSGR